MAPTGMRLFSSNFIHHLFFQQAGEDAKMSILCFGNVQLDVLCRSVVTLPPLGGIEQIDQIDVALGGNGGNVSAVLGRLGLDVELAGYRSTDMSGEQLT